MWRGTIQEMGLLMAKKAIRLPSGLGLMGLALAVFISSTATAKDAPGACVSKPYVVKIHADWCGTCKKLARVWEGIVSSLEEQATIVTFDVTDRAAYEHSRDEAERLGIGEFFAEYRKRTGAVAILDCKTREPVEILIGEPDVARYREALSRAADAG